MRLALLLLAGCAVVPRSDVRAQAALPAPAVPAFKYTNTVNLGEVDDENTVETLASLKLLSEHKAKEATLRIDSPGGSVFVGFRFIRDVSDMKKLSGMRINCVVDGAAYSMAAVILESPVCDTRLATPSSTVLFHNAHGAGEGSAEQISSAAMLLEALNGALASFVSQRLRMPVATYRLRVAGRDWAMDAARALQVGALDAVVDQAEIAPPEAE